MPLNPDDKPDPTLLRMREHAAKEIVLRLALQLAAHDFAEAAEDPGWEADYKEKHFRDAVCVYAQTIEARRSANA